MFELTVIATRQGAVWGVCVRHAETETKRETETETKRETEKEREDVKPGKGDRRWKQDYYESIQVLG